MHSQKKEVKIGKKPFYQINHYIKAKKLRVVNDKGEQIGILDKSEALKKAREKNLDLVEVAPKAKPPVAKIIDFNKFKYLQNKKQKGGSKGKVELKEVHLSPFIAENDLNTRVNRIEKFIKNGDRAKLVVKFSGREITRKEFGYEVLDKVVKKVKNFAKPDGKPKLKGKRLYLTLNPA